MPFHTRAFATPEPAPSTTRPSTTVGDGFGQRGGRCGAAIDGDDKICTLRFQMTERVRARPVAFGQAIRNVQADLLPPGPKIAGKNGRACATIDVIVGKDGDILAVDNRVKRQRRGFHHVLEAVWIREQGAQGRVKKGLDVFGRDPARFEQSGQ